MSIAAPLAPSDAAPREDPVGRLLDEIAVSIRSQRRIRTVDDETVALGTDDLSLVYVLDGEVRVHGDSGLPEVFLTGDAMLSTGRRTLSAHIPPGSHVLVSRLSLATGALHLNSLLPATAWIRRFDELEPAAAALAHHMGVGPLEDHVERGGGMVICRMMATMLVQSMIRAWATVGCAPEGWPSRTGDLFLDRVLDAVGDDPGREWTVEQMASIAALSRSVFAARFHAALGQSPASYVTEVRMASAKRMLNVGRSVSDTARELGYVSDEGFSRAFRRATGITPSRWRAEERVPATV